MENIFDLGQFGEQLVLFGAIILAFVFWIWGKIRYDVVALIALLIIVLGGVIPFEEAFLGFSSPAVMIVAAVLIMSRGIINTGFIDFLLAKIPIKNKKIWIQISILSAVTAVISAFIYSIGALAIIMPLAISVARKEKISPAYYLIPLAFASHMGGFLTLIGNAPNIIVSSLRSDLGMEPFHMFDFGRVGIWLTVAAVLFISLIGWRLIPKREEKKRKEDVAKVEDYTSEILVLEDSKFINQDIKDLKKEIKEEFSVSSIIRGGMNITEPENDEKIMKADLILVKGDAEVIRKIISLGGFKLNTPKEREGEKNNSNIVEAEAVVGMKSKIIGSALKDIRIDLVYNVDVAAISRQGREIKEKLKDLRISLGDVLLLRGEEEDINEFLSNSKLLPLAERYINIRPTKSMFFTLSIFLLSVLLATFNILPVEIAFFLGAALMLFTGILTSKQAYQNIDWPIIILLGAMIPFGQAMITSGAADIISSWFLTISDIGGPLLILAIFLAVTILLSDLINSIGVAVLMAPIAILLAQGLGVSIDPFLMAVAIGGSCGFLTPVGHQANLLVMEPGGYKFTDYWKSGIFLNIIIFVVSIIFLPIVWPF